MYSAGKLVYNGGIDAERKRLRDMSNEELEAIVAEAESRRHREPDFSPAVVSPSDAKKMGLDVSGYQGELKGWPEHSGTNSDAVDATPFERAKESLKRLVSKSSPTVVNPRELEIMGPAYTKAWFEEYVKEDGEPSPGIWVASYPFPEQPPIRFAVGPILI